MLVSIKRFNPETDAFFVSEYSLDFNNEHTILDLLQYIKDYIDPTLTFRSFCRSAICGSCALVVNDRSVLTCKEAVKNHLHNDTLLIESLHYQKPIRDLVTDLDDSLEKLKKTQSWCESNEKTSQTPEEFAKINRQTDCILCMACYSECEPLEQKPGFAGPFAFTKVWRFMQESRDAREESFFLNISKENHLYECIQCKKCIMACPKGITSAYDIKNIMDLDMKSYGSDYELSFF